MIISVVINPIHAPCKSQGGVMLRLRVKTREGGQVALTERVRGDSTLEDLSAAIHDVTAIPPRRQKILIGEFQNDVVIIILYYYYYNYCESKGK